MGLWGISGYEVTVEVFLTGGLPRIDVVGLPDSAVKESRERVRAAIKNSGMKFPVSRLTVNLAPADTKKEGTVYDLPILLGVLVASGWQYGHSVWPFAIACARVMGWPLCIAPHTLVL